MENNEIYSATALSLFKELTTDNSFSAKGLGLDDEIISILASLDFNEQISLIKEACRYVNLSIDTPALEKQLKKIELLRHDREFEDYFLLSYAPCKLMKCLFGMHPLEFSQRRKRLGINGKSGRPLLCDEETDILIWELWTKFESLELKQRYIKTAELSNQNIDTIWATLQRYDSGFMGK